MADSKRVLTIDTFGAPNPHTVVTDCESLRELYRTFETAGTNRLLGLVRVLLHPRCERAGDEAVGESRSGAGGSFPA